MTATLTESICTRCGSPFDSRTITIPAPGNGEISFPAKVCLHCEGEAARDMNADFRALNGCKSTKTVKPIPLPDVLAKCMVCGDEFKAEALKFPGDGKTIKDAVSHATVCDQCSKAMPMMAKVAAMSTGDKRAKDWTRIVGPRYASFDPAQLPEPCQAVKERVLGWTLQTRGIGLSGPPRTGKSPLIFALGRQLFMQGVDVFPTSGIAFQRWFLRGCEDKNKNEWSMYLRQCEDSEVLLIDDADKLNLSAGVEAEYYGMLETRRNWLRPVLCTLNLTGAEIAALGRERSDRAAAIVERLRDLCEIIAV